MVNRLTERRLRGAALVSGEWVGEAAVSVRTCMSVTNDTCTAHSKTSLSLTFFLNLAIYKDVFFSFEAL